MCGAWCSRTVHFLFALLLVTCSSVLAKARVGFDERGFVEIDGRPRLIIGLYELPEDDAKLKEVSDSGFNLVRAPQDTVELDRIWSHGLYTWICLGQAVQLGENDTEGRQRLTEFINRYKDHQSLLVWELPDEAMWNIWWSNTIGFMAVNSESFFGI